MSETEGLTKNKDGYSRESYTYQPYDEPSELVVWPNEDLYMAKSSGPSTHRSEVHQKVHIFIVYFIINAMVQ